MYEIVWTPTAKQAYYSTLEYWIQHNKSNSYALKIAYQVRQEEETLKKSPLFLSKYLEHIKLYRKIFFKGKFALYYRIEDNKIIIRYFRSTRQKPL